MNPLRRSSTSPAGESISKVGRSVSSYLTARSDRNCLSTSARAVTYLPRVSSLPTLVCGSPSWIIRLAASFFYPAMKKTTTGRLPMRASCRTASRLEFHPLNSGPPRWINQTTPPAARAIITNAILTGRSFLDVVLLGEGVWPVSSFMIFSRLA